MKVLNLLLLNFFFVACASNITFKTNPPGAEVIVSTGDKFASLGQSPVTIEESKVGEKLGVNLRNIQYYRVMATKDGQASESVLLPVGLFGGTKTTVVIPMKNENNVANPDKVIRHVINAQKFAENKQLTQSHNELDDALKLAPRFSYAMSMKGALFFANKDFKRSKEWYSKALKADPGNSEALLMLKELEKNNYK